MDVGDHSDAQAIKSGRQAPHRNIADDAIDVVTLVSDTVRGYPGECSRRDDGR